VFHPTFSPRSELANRAKSDGMLKGDSLISFYNYEKSFELSENEKYLNFLIYLMSGTVSADRIGHIPRSFMKEHASINAGIQKKNGLNVRSIIDSCDLSGFSCISRLRIIVMRSI
jgi:hypothetical protein